MLLAPYHGTIEAQLARQINRWAWIRATRLPFNALPSLTHSHTRPSIPYSPYSPSRRGNRIRLWTRRYRAARSSTTHTTVPLPSGLTGSSPHPSSCPHTRQQRLAPWQEAFSASTYPVSSRPTPVFYFAAILMRPLWTIQISISQTVSLSRWPQNNQHRRRHRSQTRKQ